MKLLPMPTESEKCWVFVYPVIGLKAYQETIHVDENHPIQIDNERTSTKHDNTACQHMESVCSAIISNGNTDGRAFISQ